MNFRRCLGALTLLGGAAGAATTINTARYGMKVMTTLADTGYTGSGSFTLVLIRHGETSANRAEIRQGHCDYPLTLYGEDDARRVGQALQNVKWQRTYCSDLLRANRTAKLLLQQHVDSEFYLNSLQKKEELREISFGILEEQHKTITLEQASKSLAEKLGISIDEVDTRAESLENVTNRQGDFLSHVVNDLKLDGGDGGGDGGDGGGDGGDGGGNPQTQKSKQQVLCVSHGAFIKHFLTNYCDVSKEQFKSIKNCSVTTIDVQYQNKKTSNGEYECEFRCVANLDQSNCVPHIPDVTSRTTEVELGNLALQDTSKSDYTFDGRVAFPWLH